MISLYGLFKDVFIRPFTSHRHNIGHPKTEVKSSVDIHLQENHFLLSHLKIHNKA